MGIYLRIKCFFYVSSAGISVDRRMCDRLTLLQAHDTLFIQYNYYVSYGSLFFYFYNISDIHVHRK